MNDLLSLLGYTYYSGPLFHIQGAPISLVSETDHVWLNYPSGRSAWHYQPTTIFGTYTFTASTYTGMYFNSSGHLVIGNP